MRPAVRARTRGGIRQALDARVPPHFRPSAARARARRHRGAQLTEMCRVYSSLARRWAFSEASLPHKNEPFLDRFCTVEGD